MADILNDASLSADRETQNTWQPIETAPKTPNAILVWVGSIQCSFAVWWDEVNQKWVIFGGGWRSFLSGDNGPTHWMPLPEPPQEGDD